MPGLFDALKRGTFDLFSGAPEGIGSREGMINAGLATLAAPDKQDPLAQIAQGAMFGRQVGQETRDKAKVDQNRAALQGFLQEAGYDRDGLTAAFFRATAAGDMELAKSLSEMIKSIPQTPSRNLHFSESVVQSEESPTGWGRQQVVADPLTGQVISTRILGAAPDPAPPSMFERTVRTIDPEDGLEHEYGIVRGTANKVDFGVVARSSGGGTGGQQALINQNLAAAMQQAEEDLSRVESELASPIVGGIANLAGGTGPLSYMAKGVLSMFPSAQLATAARERWVAPAVRLMSGAQMTEQERQTYRVAYTPQPFDADAVRREKAIARGMLAALFANDPDALADLPEGEAAQLLDQIARAAGLDPEEQMRLSREAGVVGLPDLPVRGR